MPSVPADEGWKFKGGARVQKIRAIDDFHISGINGPTSVGERTQYEDLDILLEILPALARAGPRRPFHIPLRKDDVVGAYKALAVRREPLLCVVTLAPESTRRGAAMQLSSCPCGALSSVHSWHKVGAAFQRMLLALFWVAHPRFVDGCFRSSPKRREMFRRWP